MNDDLERKRDLKIRIMAAHANLMSAMDMIDESDYCRLERLTAQVGKLAGEVELDYLRALEIECDRLELEKLK